MDFIDLRSDFLARPNEAMSAANTAARDSHFFGLREDPWQRRLEAHVADLLGMEDALVFPTCTMANTTALMLSAAPGSRVLTQPYAHVLVSEAGAGAALCGLNLIPVRGAGSGPAAGAMPPLANWAVALDGKSDVQRPPVRLCVLENTHNRGGGVPLPPAYTSAVATLARAAGARLHLDGSRILNAAQALGLPASALTAGFDTVSISLNKTLGAPIAALLAGSRETIDGALIIRQRLGGGIRPTGPASAASLTGLGDLSHLAQVQVLTRRLMQGLSGCPGLAVEAIKLPTNIVIARVHPPATPIGMVAKLEANGLRAMALDGEHIRFVVYRGIDADQIERAISIAHEVSTNL